MKELASDLAELRTAALLRILELSHEALVTGVVTTKRSLIQFLFNLWSIWRPYDPAFQLKTHLFRLFGAHADIYPLGTCSIGTQSYS
jgi:hypothetical protein